MRDVRLRVAVATRAAVIAGAAVLAPAGFTACGGGGDGQVGAPPKSRALDYQKAGFGGGATGTRVDIVTVEECAEGGSTRVRHRTWRLVDSAGRTLGVAGGKIVNGNPTEDLPETLSSGECRATMLAIGVPNGSTPVAVQDGPDDTWTLAN